MKKLLWIVATPIILVLVAIAALVLFVNPNQFKPLITEQARQQTGLELVIDGDLSWQFFPSLGFSLGKTELRNPAGFTNPNMLSISQVGLAVEVSPLLSKQLVIGEVLLDGAQFSMETLKDGRSNLQALSGAKSQSQQAEQKPVAQESQAPAESAPSQSAAEGWTISLAGIRVTNAKVDVVNHQAGSRLSLFDMNFSLDKFALDSWTHASFETKGTTGPQSFTATGDVDLKLAGDLQSYEIRDLVFDASYQDAANKIEKAKVTLGSLNFGKPNALSFELSGLAAGLDIEAKATTELTVDKALTKAQLGKLTLASVLKGDALPQSPMKVDMDSELSFDMVKQHLAFELRKLTANKLQFDGKADVTLAEIPKVRFKLHSPEIDLDEFLGLGGKAPASGDTAPQGGEQPAPGSKPVVTEPDLSALKGLDVKGTIVIDKFKAANAKVNAVTTSFSVNRGVAVLNSFSAKLYEGSITASGKLDARRSPASYSVKQNIKGIQVHPLFVDVAEFDLVEGTGNLSVDVKGKSLIPDVAKQHLAGVVKINFADGAVYGINVPQLIRTNYARFKGQPVEELNETKKTDFSALTATLKLNKGVMTTNDMHMESPLLRIAGQGNVNYIQQTMDMLIRTSIVGTLEGQGGKSIDDLRDVTIPINVSGSWTDPQYKLVFDDVLKQKARQEAERGLKKLLGDKVDQDDTKKIADQLLKGLFN